MNTLSEVVKATVKLFRQYGKGHSNESWKSGTLAHAAYCAVRDYELLQTPFELEEFSRELRKALARADLNDHKQALAEISLAAFVPSEDVNGELILLRWRLKLGAALAPLVLERWPSLRKYYPHLF